MYAVLVAVSIENEEEAREQLLNQVVPGVKQIPGVVSGVWLSPQNGQGYSTVVFETEEQAKAASETVRDRVPPGVTVNHVSVQEVTAHF
jgi:dihydrodipicolinate synthase/N-acetylneuraminate lyase